MNIQKSPYSEEEGGRRKEEEGGERWAPNKAGPMRPPLLNRIKWKCIEYGIYMDIFLDQKDNEVKLSHMS